MFKGLDNKLNFSTAYHPQTDGQTKRVIQVLENMLQMFVRDYHKKWEDYLHLVEFAYNNHYQVWAKISPFEIFYGRKCNTPISWINPDGILMLGPDLLKEMELTVKHVQRNLKTGHDRQKSHADLKITSK